MLRCPFNAMGRKAAAGNHERLKSQAVVWVFTGGRQPCTRPCARPALAPAPAPALTLTLDPTGLHDRSEESGDSEQEIFPPLKLNRRFMSEHVRYVSVKMHIFEWAALEKRLPS